MVIKANTSSAHYISHVYHTHRLIFRIFSCLKFSAVQLHFSLSRPYWMRVQLQMTCRFNIQVHVTFSIKTITFQVLACAAAHLAVKASSSLDASSVKWSLRPPSKSSLVNPGASSTE